MGLGSSTLQGVTREQLLKSTQSSRDFTNKLFNVMITKFTPEDLMKLSKTQSCSSFVFVMADSIGKLFDDLRIRPKKDRDSGVVLFQKMDTLRAPTAESRQLCLVIAYFYVRLFQIFGALALTIIDDPSAGAALGVLQYAPRAAADVRRIPGARGPIMLGGAREDLFRTGALLKYRYIRDLLEDPEQISIGREQVRYSFRFIENSDLLLIPSRPDGNLYFTINEGTFVTVKLDLQSVVQKTDGTFRQVAILSGFKYKDANLDTTQSNAIAVFLRDKYSTAKRIEFISMDKLSWYYNEGSFTETIINEIEKVHKVVQKFIENPDAYRRGVNPYAGVNPYGVDRVPVGRGSNVGTHKVLMNQYIIQTLKGMAGYKTTSFCVARALQLLDANSLYQPRPMESISGVCATRFDALPIAVPEARKSITSVPGLKALDQLYFVNPHLGPKDETAFDTSADYSAFLSKMSEIFSKSQAKMSSLDSVLAADPQCPAASVKHYLRVQDPAAIQKVLGVVKTLFGNQLAHTKKVIAFFRERLFLIKKSSSGEFIDIHPRILQGGMVELANLSKDARELLVEYYTGCEGLYQKGVQEVLKAKSVPI